MRVKIKIKDKLTGNEKIFNLRFKLKIIKTWIKK